MKYIILTTALILGATSLASCATISEDECLAGSWEEIGFRDGERGKSRSKLADYAKTCVKYEIAPDRQSYFKGFEQGLLRYCTYDKGFSTGEYGNQPNAECQTVPDNGYYAGYDEGRIIWSINQEYQELINSYEETIDALVEVERKLTEDELTDETHKRLRKKRLRLEDRREDDRIEIRAFERIHGLSKYDF